MTENVSADAGIQNDLAIPRSRRQDQNRAAQATGRGLPKRNAVAGLPTATKMANGARARYPPDEDGRGIAILILPASVSISEW
jgi:hypothetical protein